MTIANSFGGRCARCREFVKPGLGVVIGRRIWCVNCSGPALDAEAEEHEHIARSYEDRDPIYGFDDV